MPRDERSRVTQPGLPPDLLFAAFDQSDEAILVADADLVIRFVNRAFARNAGADVAALVGRPVTVLAVNETPAVLAARLARVLERGEPQRRVAVDRRRGAAFAEISYTPLTDPEGRTAGLVWRERNVTRREQRLRRLATIAEQDTLTGLANRQRVLAALGALCRSSQKPGPRARPFAVIYIDLDGFKRVNDLFGHACGDEVLAVVGDRLGRAARDVDLLGRVGGDEFVGLLPNMMDTRDALIAARRLLDAVNEPVETEHGALPLRASAGIAIGPFDGTTAEELLAAADGAMYRAKRVGGDRCALVRTQVRPASAGERVPELAAEAGRAIPARAVG